MSRARRKAPRAESRTIEVWADWQGLEKPTLVGRLTGQTIRGNQVLCFAYDDGWLRGPRVQIDPHLPLHPGNHWPQPPLTQFGVFADASPDRWGRTLLDRREAQKAREQGRPRRALTSLDYLLGVYDGHRMGALRFREGEGPFLDDDDGLAAPPWTSLAELEFASQQLERVGVEEDPRFGRWLAMLLAPGRSLGGARPKASVVDGAGGLWIAKFPSTNDTRDVGAWEWVVHQLAQDAGLDVPEAQRRRFATRHHTFLSRRFDRLGTERHHFSSAMTQLGQADGQVDPSLGYLDIAEFLAREGAEPDTDMAEVWRRIVFAVCVSNTDDHLRNHGFLRTRKGWRLSPAYDLNPSTARSELALPYDGVDAQLDLDLVREASPLYRLNESAAAAVLAEVLEAARKWRQVAERAGIPREERNSMASAFRIADEE